MFDGYTMTTQTEIERLIENAEAAILNVRREWERLYGPAELDGLANAEDELNYMTEAMNNEQDA